MFNKNYKKIRKIVFFLLLMISLPLVLAENTSAVVEKTLSENEYEEVERFMMGDKQMPQGGTITPDYYVISRWKDDGSNNQVIVCPRNSSNYNKSLSKCKIINNIDGHMNVFYYDKGTNRVHVYYGAKNKTDACVQLDADMSKIKLIDAKGCANILQKRPLDDPKGGKSVTQGETNYGGYLIDTQHFYTKTQGKLHIYDNKGKKLAIITMKVSGEIEDVSADENGDLYVLWSKGKSTPASMYKIRASVWMGLIGANSADVISGGIEINTSGNNILKKRENLKAKLRAKKREATCSTTILKSFSCSPGSEADGIGIAKMVLNILLVCSGALASVGIIFTGVIWMTAGGNIEQVKKAKKRLVEIVIGILILVLFGAIINFLLPNTNAEDMIQNKTTSSSSKR